MHEEPATCMGGFLLYISVVVPLQWQRNNFETLRRTELVPMKSEGGVCVPREGAYTKGSLRPTVIASDKKRTRDRLIVALDFSSAAEAISIAEKLRGHVGLFKVGSQLFTAEGPVVARHLAALGEKVFLDLKFHDIPNTVHAAAREAARIGVAMLNVHASGGRKMMEAALEGSREGSSGRERPLVLAVTVLTSLGTDDLAAIGL